jgi:hypothetical protein
MTLVDGEMPLNAELLIVTNRVCDPLLKAIKERPYLINFTRCFALALVVRLECECERILGPTAATIQSVASAGVSINLDSIEAFFEFASSTREIHNFMLGDTLKELLRHCVPTTASEAVSFSDHVFQWVGQMNRDGVRQLFSLYLDAGADFLATAPASPTRPEELWISRAVTILRQDCSTYYIGILLDVLESKWQPDDPRWTRVRPHFTDLVSTTPRPATPVSPLTTLTSTAPIASVTTTTTSSATTTIIEVVSVLLVAVLFVFNDKLVELFSAVAL